MAELYRRKKKVKDYTKFRYVVYYLDGSGAGAMWQGSHRFLWTAKFDAWGLLHFGGGIREVWVRDQHPK